LEDKDVNGMIILKWVAKKWDRNKDKIVLAQDRDGWQALVTTIMNLPVP
jgi:hypothetical protein